MSAHERSMRDLAEQCANMEGAHDARSAEEIGVRDLVRRMFSKYDVRDVDVERLPRTEGHTYTWGELKRMFNLGEDAERRAGIQMPPDEPPTQSRLAQLLSRQVDRRTAVKLLAMGMVLGFGFLQTACTPLLPFAKADEKKREIANLKLEEYFKRNYRLMTEEEKRATIERLERLAELETGKRPTISTQGPRKNVLYGYAFNISKCRGYLECIKACVLENNQDRSTDMRYIRIHEIPAGGFSMERANDSFYHEVPAEGHFYIGTQCFHCENPPCVEVCPVQATWKEEDGIVVVDYDWCIGCRYCQAACPYDGRRFNWKTPHVPVEEINLNQHYLGNRLRKKGVMEKCTFCIQRTRQGRLPACVEACPTGARVFGNLLDPNSEIRWILENKKVFRLKEDLGTEPKFWYYMD
nr:4Fe-4S dicluster domain-containing protein [Ardenticatena sp.]